MTEKRKNPNTLCFLTEKEAKECERLVKINEPHREKIEKKIRNIMEQFKYETKKENKENLHKEIRKLFKELDKFVI